MRPYSTPPSRPCIVCGKSIARLTHVVWINSKEAPYRGHPDSVDADLKTMKDCQTHAGTGYVFALRFWHGYVYRYSVWDGHTYVDPFFCSVTCAGKQGYAAARAGYRISRLDPP